MFGTKEFLAKGSTRSKLTLTGMPEKEDKLAFDIPEEGRNPIPIDVWKFRIPVRLSMPNPNFLEYLNHLSDYIDPKDDAIWTDELFGAFIEMLWVYYKSQFMVYLFFS
jgi:hypothetical protein